VLLKKEVDRTFLDSIVDGIIMYDMWFNW